MLGRHTPMTHLHSVKTTCDRLVQDVKIDWRCSPELRRSDGRVAWPKLHEKYIQQYLRRVLILTRPQGLQAL